MRPFFAPLLLAVSVLSTPVSAPAAEPPPPRWDSIDQRPTPQWWRDAKFGIFIHWGPYSVPAYSRVGEYSECYWRDLVDPKRDSHATIRTYHDRVFGPAFAYADFVRSFRCELFDLEQWASIFQKSGARYVVLTPKHHDGYSLWPSREVDLSRGRPWNSEHSGPRRDLLGELTAAVRKTNVRMGICFPLYEWFNPLYVAQPDLHVTRHLLPQFKDVVSRYAPSVIFSDGEWEHPAATWRSTEMLHWLFTEPPCKDEVVINDRWGRETRHAHGGYYTTP